MYEGVEYTYEESPDGSRCRITRDNVILYWGSPKEVQVNVAPLGVLLSFSIERNFMNV